MGTARLISSCTVGAVVGFFGVVGVASGIVGSCMVGGLVAADAVGDDVVGGAGDGGDELLGRGLVDVELGGVAAERRTMMRSRPPGRRPCCG